MGLLLELAAPFGEIPTGGWVWCQVWHITAEKLCHANKGGGVHPANCFHLLWVLPEATCADNVTKEWYFFTPYLSFVCIEAETSFMSTFHNCFKVGMVVIEVASIIYDYVISNPSYAREVTEGLIDFLLKNVLGADQTKGDRDTGICICREVNWRLCTRSWCYQVWYAITTSGINYIWWNIWLRSTLGVHQLMLGCSGDGTVEIFGV